MSYFVYILKCADNTYYTGVTNNLEKRLYAHNYATTGAKYTKARRPVQLVYSEKAVDRGAAQSREYVIRKLKRMEKEKLLAKYDRQKAGGH